ncbi:unnamed protein product [marine sediment metagenome]|uniref:Uncharacterized protein n=1 Tax=marine sediment metagenome TaxID=412755 RepID=X0U5E8_9ZZZZ
MDKDKIVIFLSLLFWVQVTVIAVLGVKLLFFNSSKVVEEEVVTPAMVREINQ